MHVPDTPVQECELLSVQKRKSRPFCGSISSGSIIDGGRLYSNWMKLALWLLTSCLVGSVNWHIHLFIQSSFGFTFLRTGNQGCALSYLSRDRITVVHHKGMYG